MRGPSLAIALICLLVAGGFLLGLNGCGSATQSTPGAPAPSRFSTSL